MKKLLLPIALASAVIFTACGDKKEETNRDMVLLTDPSHNNNLLTDTGAVQQTVPAPQQEVAVAPPVRVTTAAPRPSKPKYNQPVVNNNPVTQAPVATPSPAPEATPTPAPSTETASTGGTGTTETEAAPAAEPAKKKGISNTAKGAIIGGVGGAVAGAVIGKNGKGAIIGGVIGAAGGAILGKKKDKKEEAAGN